MLHMYAGERVNAGEALCIERALAGRAESKDSDHVCGSDRVVLKGCVVKSDQGLRSCFSVKMSE